MPKKLNPKAYIPNYRDNPISFSFTQLSKIQAQFFVAILQTATNYYHNKKVNSEKLTFELDLKKWKDVFNWDKNNLYLKKTDLEIIRSEASYRKYYADGKIDFVGCFEKISYIPKKGLTPKIIFTLTKSFVNDVISIFNKFDKLRIEMFVKMKSKYTPAMYFFFIKNYQKKTSYLSTEIKKLKKELNIEKKYSRDADLFIRVINPVVKDLNNIGFNIQALKEKKTSAINWIINDYPILADNRTDLEKMLFKSNQKDIREIEVLAEATKQEIKLKARAEKLKLKTQAVANEAENQWTLLAMIKTEKYKEINIIKKLTDDDDHIEIKKLKWQINSLVLSLKQEAKKAANAWTRADKPAQAAKWTKLAQAAEQEPTTLEKQELAIQKRKLAEIIKNKAAATRAKPQKTYLIPVIDKIFTKKIKIKK